MTTTQITQVGRGVIAAAAVLATASVNAAEMSQEQFLADVQSGDAQKQLAAWEVAEKQDPSVIEPLSKMLVSDNMSVVKTANQSLMKIVHSVGKSVDDPKRKAVTAGLLALLKQDSTSIQTFALRALALVADGESVATIAPFLTNEALQEEAAFCLERIPGKQSADALMAGVDQVQDSFKPRMIAALGHRKVEAAVPVIDKYFQSPNLDLAMAAVKAIGRIGEKPEGSPPQFESLSTRQKKVLMDSLLRYCDARIQKGDLEFPQNVLVGLLGESEEIEEHYLCAAIVSLSRIDTPEVAEAIVKQVNRPLYIVRDTAIKNLVSMKGNNVEPALQKAIEMSDGDTKKALQDILAKRKA